MAAAIPRGGLVSLAVFCALMFGAPWVVFASHMGRAVDHCLAVEGSLWPGECRLLIKYPSAVAVASLLLTLWLWRREAQFEAKIREAAGGAEDGHPDPALALALGPERRRLGDSDAKATEIVYGILVCCVAVMVVGALLRCAGAWLLVSGEGASALVEFGHIFCNVGFYSFAAELFCLIMPFSMLTTEEV